MALNFRQRYLWNYVIDVWRQDQDPQANTAFSAGVPVLTDFGPSYTRVYQDINALFWSAAENAMPTTIGRTRVDMIFTLDRWKVETAVEIFDTDIIVCTAGPNNFKGVGQVWVAQGDTQDHSTLTGTNAGLVYSKRIDNAPLGVSGQYPSLGI